MATYKGYTLDGGATWLRYSETQLVSGTSDTYKLSVGDKYYAPFTIGNAILNEENVPVDTTSIKWVGVELTKKPVATEPTPEPEPTGINYYAALDGIDDYIEGASHDTSLDTGMSIQFKLRKPVGGDNNGMLFWLGTNPGQQANSLQIGNLSSNSLDFRFYNNRAGTYYNQMASAYNTITPGEDQHWTINIHPDGRCAILRDSVELTSKLLGLPQNIKRAFMTMGAYGYDLSLASSYARVDLNDVMIWDHPRTSEQIAVDMKGYTSPQTGLVRYHKLDGNASDSSGYVANGVLHGGMLFAEVGTATPVVAPTEPTPTEPAPTEPDPGTYITGEIPYDHLNWAFDNGSGRQDFSPYFDRTVEFGPGVFHTDSSRKEFDSPNHAYFTFPESLDVTLQKIVLEDGQGSNSLGIRYHAILNDANKTHVYDVIPPFLGSDFNKYVENLLAPEHQKVLAIIMETPLTTDRLPSVTPSGMSFHGSYKVVTQPQRTRNLTPVQKSIGAVIYPPNIGSPALKADKVDMLKTNDLYRLYLDMKNLRHPDTGLYTFEPCLEGGWLLDTYINELDIQGKTVILCPKVMIGYNWYPELCKQLAIRYGSNTTVPDSEVKVYLEETNSWQGEASKNQIKKGLGYNIMIQLDNEPNRHWKGRADLANQINIEGFQSPFELAKSHMDAYAAIKAIDPNITVLSSGMAVNNPGLFLGMLFWAKVYGGGKKMFDAVSYHDYCNQAGGQREGAYPAWPPELTNYRKSADDIMQAIFLATGENIGAYITETGSAIATENPEQAVVPIGAWDRYEVQGIVNVRLQLDGLRAGLHGITTYQMYDDSIHVHNPTAWINWDLAMGIADRNTNDVHKRRPATDYTWQMLKELSGYTMTVPAVHGSSVYIDKLEHPTKPDIYVAYLPTYDSNTSPHTIELPGATAVTILRLTTGADVLSAQSVAVSGSISLELDMKPVFIRLDNELAVKGSVSEPSFPNVNFGVPYKITAGGTYSNLAVESTDSEIPAVEITTSDPVIIENSSIRGAGYLIKSWYTNANITVRNTHGYGLPPTAWTSYMKTRRFVTLNDFSNLVIENCHLEGTSGIYVGDGYNGDGSINNTIRIVGNTAKNIDGRVLNGFERSQFVQLNFRNPIAHAEVAWNRVINNPDESLVEDNINLHNVRGTLASPILIHDNYIQGAFPIPAGTQDYSGGGIIMDSSGLTTNYDTSVVAFVKVYDNHTVAIRNYNYAIATAHDVEVYNNRAISAHREGIDHHKIALYGYDYYNTGATYNAVMRDNYASLNSPGTVQNYFPDGTVTNTNNQVILDIATFADEAAEYDRWVKKVVNNGIFVGVQ